MKKLFTGLLLLIGLNSFAQFCADEDTVRNNAVSLITATTARVNGTTSHLTGLVLSIQLRYVRVGFTDTATVSASGTNPLRNLTSLVAGTQYVYYYNSFCGSGTIRQVGTYTFTTTTAGVVYAPERSTYFPYAKADSNFKIPRMNTLSLYRAVGSLGGDLAYNTSDSLPYYWNGVSWKYLAVDSAGILPALNRKVDSVTVTGDSLFYWINGTGYGYILPNGNAWSRLGNSGTTAGTNFIGTTDDCDLVVKRNSIETGRFGYAGAVSSPTFMSPILIAGTNSKNAYLFPSYSSGTKYFLLPYYDDSVSTVNVVTSVNGKYADLSGNITDTTSGGVYTASNGLTMSGNNTKLGGTLINDTYITGNKIFDVRSTVGTDYSYSNVDVDSASLHQGTISYDNFISLSGGLINLNSIGGIVMKGLTSQYNAADSMMVILPGTGKVGYRAIPTSSGGTVTGTGTAGQLTKWTGTSSIGDATTGTGVLTALGVNTGSAGAFQRNNDGFNGTVGATTPSTGAFTTGSFSGQVTNTTNGAASTPPSRLTGTWFTGGTATTTKPQLLIEPTGTTSTAWSTSGTGLGINAASGFTGLLFDFKVNNSSLIYGSNTGYLRASAGIESTTFFQAGASSYFQFQGRGYFTAPSVSSFAFVPASGNLQMMVGGTTSSFPSLVRNGTGIDIKLADNSDYTNLGVKNLTLNTAGSKINVTTGSNASAGLSGAMTSGTITISTTAVTASSLIFLTAVGAGTGQISLGTVTAGTSFVINSSDVLDSRQVQWWIIN